MGGVTAGFVSFVVSFGITTRARLSVGKSSEPVYITVSRELDSLDRIRNTWFCFAIASTWKLAYTSRAFISSWPKIICLTTTHERGVYPRT